jgi:hypothetical protein
MSILVNMMSLLDLYLSRAKNSYRALARILACLDAKYPELPLARLHADAENAVLLLFIRDPGLANFVLAYDEHRARVVRCDHDMDEAPLLANTAFLLGGLLDAYPMCFGQNAGTVAHRLQTLVEDLLRKRWLASNSQVTALLNGVARIASTIQRVLLPDEKIVVLELPIGNSIPVKLLSIRLNQVGLGHRVEPVMLVRNEKKWRGVTRAALMAQRLADIDIAEPTLLVYVDEWSTGKNFNAVAEEVAKYVRRPPRPVRRLLPIGLLKQDSHEHRDYTRFAKDHDALLSPLGLADADARIVLPPVMGRLSSREYFSGLNTIGVQVTASCRFSAQCWVTSNRRSGNCSMTPAR